MRDRILKNNDASGVTWPVLLVIERSQGHGGHVPCDAPEFQTSARSQSFMRQRGNRDESTK